MTSYTDKLGLPLPIAERAGDANDVIDLVDTVNNILEYLDRGAGDFLPVWGEFNFATPNPVEGMNNAIIDVVSGFITLPHLETYDPDKIGWVEDGESEFLRFNFETGNFEIKRAGNYRFYSYVAYATEDADGGGAISLTLNRTGVQQGMNDSGLFSIEDTVTGNPFMRKVALAQNQDFYLFNGWIGPNFYLADEEITPQLHTVDCAITPVAMIIGAERL